MSYYTQRDKVLAVIDTASQGPDIDKAKLITDALYIYMQDFIGNAKSPYAAEVMYDANDIAQQLYTAIAEAERIEKNMPKRKWKIMVPVVTYEERFADSENEAWNIASAHAVDVCGEVSEVTEDDNA